MEVSCQIKVKGVPRQAEVALGVPGRLRPRIISTFGTTRVVGRQPYAPAAFTPGEIPGTHFQRLSRPQGTWFCRKEPREKKSPVTPPGIDPGTVQLVAQRLNHYATPVVRLRIRIFTSAGRISGTLRRETGWALKPALNIWRSVLSLPDTEHRTLSPVA